MRAGRRQPVKKDGLYGALKFQIFIVVVLLASAYMIKEAPNYEEIRSQVLYMMDTNEVPNFSEFTIPTFNDGKEFVGELIEAVNQRVYEISKENNYKDVKSNFDNEIAEETLLSDYEAKEAITGGNVTEGEAENELPTWEPTKEFESENILDGKGGLNPFQKSEILQVPKDVSLAPVVLTAKPLLPIEGIVTSVFGYREHPLTGEPDFHVGLDIAAKEDTEILAALPGTVSEIGVSDIYGNYIVIEHSENLKTRYNHCSEIVAGVGIRVRQGARIATVGSTGVSTGPHLHFDVIVNGKYCNPIWILEELKEYRYGKYTENVTVIP